MPYHEEWCWQAEEPKESKAEQEEVEEVKAKAELRTNRQSENW